MRPSPQITLVLAIAALAAPAHADTWHVPSECPTVQAGVDSAAAGDTVLVASDTYYEHDITMKSGVYLTSETGQADCVTIDAQQLGRVIYCLDVDAAASIVGFTITGGLATGAATQDSAAGGVYCESSSPTLSNCALSGNHATGYGGGLACLWDADVTLADCTFSGNTAAKGGGGMLSYSSSTTLTDCGFSDNAAWQIGGMYLSFSNSTLTGCTFSGNTATGEKGEVGGLAVTEESSATLTSCLFYGNTAGDDSGGIGAGYSSSLTLVDCAFSGNVAYKGGGGMKLEGGCSATLTNCTFSGNTGDDSGGGLLCIEGSSAELTNCTFAGNAAEEGGGIDCPDASVTLARCIIAFSGSGEGVRCNDPDDVTLSCCDVYGNAGGDWVGHIAGQDLIRDNFSDDPLFCGEDNPDEPFTLHSDSPCASDNNPACGLVGAWGVGCETPVEETSWGSMKAMYR